MEPFYAPKTTFMSNQGNYYYNVTPFGLKTIAPHTSDSWILSFLIRLGGTLRYIDNMIIKTAKGNSLVDDLEDILQSVRKYDMYLNPSKFSFGLQTGKFLGFMLTRRG